MAQAPARLPSHLLPRSKAPATSSSSTTSLDKIAAANPPHASRASSRHRTASPNNATDVSDKATASLVRRVLCPPSHTGAVEPQPLHELLPPLTSSNEVDLQLYAILAVIVKDYIYSWYSKITPDRTFVEEVVRIFAHCTRDLEQRARRIDFGSLLLDEMPGLVSRHIQAYRAASQHKHSPSIPSNPRQVYHTLVPHPAFSPVPQKADLASEPKQLENETAYRQLLVQSVLAVLLPTEDLRNPCLRTLVGDILAELILGKGIGGKACENWMIWDGVNKIITSVKAQIEPKVTGKELEVDTRDRLEKFGLLDKADKNNSSGRKGVAHSHSTTTAVFSRLFWRILQYAQIMFVTVRFILIGLAAASSSASPRNRRSPKTTGANGQSMYSPIASDVQAPAGEQRPILSYSIFGLISEALELEWRMPWVVGGLSLVQWQLVRLQVGATDGVADKFLYSLLHTHVLSAARIPALLRNLRTALFPNNSLGRARDVPSPEEVTHIRRRAAESILGIVPLPVARRIFAFEVNSGTNESDQTTDDASAGKEEREALLRGLEQLLDTFEDPYMNKHLIFAAVELLLVRLVPEIAEKTTSQLMEERGIVGVGLPGFSGEPEPDN